MNFINGVSGLNTVVDPTRVQYDPKTGVSDLSVAVNIDIDDSGRPGRRQGFTSAQAGNFHSLFCDGGGCYVGKDKALYQVGSDLSLTGVRSGMSGEQIRYCQVLNDIYYSNGTENGIIRAGVSRAFSSDTYVGPDTNRHFAAPPVGRHLAHYRSRIYISDGPVLWWSEPFMYGLFDKAKGFIQFGSDIVMIAPVASGLFVSDRSKTVFLRGVPGGFEQETVCTYPAVEDTLAIDKVEGMEIGLQEPGLCRVWSSPEGAIMGTSGGQVINLNKDKVVYDENVTSGAGLLRGYQFIHNME
jgi:hypothetical protein